MNDSEKDRRSIAFFVYPVLRFPRNNREYSLTNELLSRGWRVKWLLPHSGKNEGVPVEDHILNYKDMDFRGRTYLLPTYLGFILWAMGIKHLWISGWSLRSDKEIYWLVRIMGLFDIDIIYDTIDPKCLIEVADNKELASSDAIKKSQKIMNNIYSLCRRVLCVTPEMKSLIVEKGAIESNLFVARWGGDLNVFNWSNIKGDFRKRYNISETVVLLGWLGSMSEFKGIRELLLPLIQNILKTREIHFLIGGDGPLFNEVEEWVKSKHLSTLTLIGRLHYRDAAEFTSSLDAYVVTTDPTSEYGRAICPVKCYDAVAMGIPLVTTRTPATEHLKQISENVYLCEYDMHSFEEAINHIVANIDNIRNSRRHDVPAMPSHKIVSSEIADMLEGLASDRL